MTEYIDVKIVGLDEAKRIIQKGTYQPDFLISITGVEDYVMVESMQNRAIRQGTDVTIMFFDDIQSEAEEDEGRYQAPTVNEVSKIVRVAKHIKEYQNTVDRTVRVLIHCQAGISRSTAIAYILLCACYGLDKIEEARKQVLRSQPFSWPNRAVVKMGDDLLGADGKMVMESEVIYQDSGFDVMHKLKVI